MAKIEIYEDEKYDLLISDASGIVIVKLKNIKEGITDFSEYEKEFTNDQLPNYLNSPGVYFIEEENGLYIGETKNFSQRFLGHSEVRKLKSITFALSGIKENSFEKSSIGDIEARLIELAKEFGIRDSMTNKIDEKYKSLNTLTQKKNKAVAKYIWEKFLLMNTEAIIRNLSSNSTLKVHKELIEASPFVRVTEVDVVNNVDEGFKQLGFNAKCNQDFSHEVFKFIEKSDMKYKGHNYKADGAKIFTKENMKKALLSYLFHKKGGAKIEVAILGESKDGWINSKSLFVMGIPTRGQSGVLQGRMSEEQATELINSFVELVYKW